MTWNTLDEFRSAVPFSRYEDSHRWHTWVAQEYATKSAWNLYEKAKRPILGFILLGETKLRSDPTLVYGFGMMTAGGIQDPEAVKMIKDLEETANQQKTPPPNIDDGSILSDRNWSPLLNDSLILAGIHRGREFHFADYRVDEFFSKSKPAKPQGVAGLRANFEKPAGLSATEVAWRNFFNGHQSVFWDSTAKIPRVLARELIGLMTFGYETKLSDHQLSFMPGKGGGRNRASFGRYLDVLNQSGYFSGDQKALLQLISKFLFGDPQAIK